jgi:hypothetical protein
MIIEKLVHNAYNIVYMCNSKTIIKFPHNLFYTVQHWNLKSPNALTTTIISLSYSCICVYCLYLILQKAIKQHGDTYGTKRNTETMSSKLVEHI